MKCSLCGKDDPKQIWSFICDDCADKCTYDLERNRKQELFTGGY